MNSQKAIETMICNWISDQQARKIFENYKNLPRWFHRTANDFLMHKKINHDFQTVQVGNYENINGGSAWVSNLRQHTGGSWSQSVCNNIARIPKEIHFTSAQWLEARLTLCHWSIGYRIDNFIFQNTHKKIVLKIKKTNINFATHPFICYAGEVNGVAVDIPAQEVINSFVELAFTFQRNETDLSGSILPTLVW